MTEPDTKVLSQVERLLFEHAPDVVGDCVCGWSLHTRRGISHATHLVQKLAAAELLAVAAAQQAPDELDSPRLSWRGRTFLASGSKRSFADGTS